MHKVLSVIICALSFIIIVAADSSYKISNKLSNIQNENLLQNHMSFPKKEKCIKSDDPELRITCSELNVNDNLTALIEEIVWSSQNQIIDYLAIESSNFEDKKLAQNWINTKNFSIKVLHLNSLTIDRIENNAFMGYAFEELEYLSLWYMRIETLEEGTFAGLMNLQRLFINTCEVKYINENTLKAVSSSLESFSMLFMILPFNPVNLTSTNPLPKLSNVDFSGNNFKDNLNANSFTQLTNCQTLELSRCRIEHIGNGTFANMLSMKVIGLVHNPLTYLDYCVFGDDVIKNFGPEGLYIGFNLWNCDCNLDWLKKLKMENIVGGNARCASHMNKTFEEVDFCDEETENPKCIQKLSTKFQPTALW